jgi:uncharacterized membrane protein YbhN (UPF0104 family)
MGKKQMWNAVKLLIKISFSALAICYVLSKLDLSVIGDAVATADFRYLVAALVVYVVSQVVSAFRLNSMFKAMGLNIINIINIRLYWLGMFYNFFLPGGVGGDGYKIYFVNKYFKTPVKSLIAAVFADRLSGLSVICVYLLALVYFIDYSFPFQGYLFLLIPLVSGAYYLFLYIFGRRLTAAFWQVCGYSLLIQGMQMVVAILILMSMGAITADQSHDYLFLFLLSSIASAVPITLGGIGAREMTFVVGSQMLGTNQEHAVALSLLFYIISLISSLPGLLYVVKPGLMVDKLATEQS